MVLSNVWLLRMIYLRISFELIAHIPQESAVVITGIVRADQRAPGMPGGYEVGITGFEVVQAAS